MTRNKFAVTGGIGSGKTALLNILRERFPVFSCDDIVRELWRERDFRLQVGKLFPACSKDGLAEKGLVANLVFSDFKARRTLEEFTHPLVLSRLMKETEELPVSFSEVPLLFEGGYQSLFDGVIVLIRGEKERVEAVMKRDNLSEEEVLSRINAQVKDGDRTGANVYFLPNDGTIEELRARTEELLHNLGL